MSTKVTYDTVAERVGLILGVPPTHIRFWTVNSTTSNPKATVKRLPNSNLLAMLNTAAYSQIAQNHRMDALFFEVLEISLDELEHKKSIKVTLLSEGITKEVGLPNSCHAIEQLPNQIDQCNRSHLTYLSTKTAR